MIWTAFAVAFFVYPTVFALREAIVRPHPVPAAPIRETEMLVGIQAVQIRVMRLTSEEQNAFIILRREKHDHTARKWQAHGQSAKCSSILISIGQVHDDELARHIDDTEGHVEQ